MLFELCHPTAELISPTRFVLFISNTHQGSASRSRESTNRKLDWREFEEEEAKNSVYGGAEGVHSQEEKRRCMLSSIDLAYDQWF